MNIVKYYVRHLIKETTQRGNYTPPFLRMSIAMAAISTDILQAPGAGTGNFPGQLKLKVSGPVEALLPAGVNPLLEFFNLFLGYGLKPALGLEILAHGLQVAPLAGQ